MNSASAESYANLLCIHLNLFKQTHPVKWRVPQMIPFEFPSYLLRVGGGCRLTPSHSIFHHVYTKVQCMLQLRGQIHSMYFISTPRVQYRYVLCSLMFLNDFFLCIYPSETDYKSILLSLPKKNLNLGAFFCW